MYDVSTLCERSHISPQTFYRLRHESAELEELVKQHREKRGKVYLYGEPVLEWLLSFYRISQDEASAPSEAQSRSEPSESRSEPFCGLGEVNTLKDKIAALEAELEAVRSSLETVERERRELFLQNSQLLLLLTQEKQEKHALLPSPRRPLLSRIRSAFSREK